MRLGREEEEKGSLMDSRTKQKKTNWQQQKKLAWMSDSRCGSPG
jgi:hypothetical protein